MSAGRTGEEAAVARTACWIPHGEPADSDAFWPDVPLLPAPLPQERGKGQGQGRSELAVTEVRALAAGRELCVRFDCKLDDPAQVAHPLPSAPIDAVERVWVDVCPAADGIRWLQVRGRLQRRAPIHLTLVHER